MTAKQLLDTARGLSKKHALQMHAWGVVRFDGADHLGLYLYEGASNVQLTLVQQCDGQADADWAKLMVDYLNNSRGLGPEGVGLFVTSYEGGRCKAGRMVKHLYP